jgi:2-phospho-L-lactate guanylyltransferase
MIFGLLPVKSPALAKQRLSGVLSPAEREALARLMYERMLATLVAARGIDRIAVVTEDARTAEQARAAGALVFEEREQESHSRSADAACRRALDLGATTTLLLPIDVPLATPEEIESLIRPGIVLVPSADGTGTNVLGCTPPLAIPARFGPNSLQAHLRSAAGKQVEVLRLPGLMLDIDTLEDIAELQRRAPDNPIARFLCASRSQA